MNELFKEIKRFRKRRKMTQSKLAKLAGLNQRDISKVENGRSDARLSTLKHLAQALDLRIMLVPKLHVIGVTELIKDQSIENSHIDNEPTSLLDQYGVQDDDE